MIWSSTHVVWLLKRRGERKWGRRNNDLTNESLQKLMREIYYKFRVRKPKPDNYQHVAQEMVNFMCQFN